jgi:hypothetical protein
VVALADDDCQRSGNLAVGWRLRDGERLRVLLVCATPDDVAQRAAVIVCDVSAEDICAVGPACWALLIVHTGQTSLVELGHTRRTHVVLAVDRSRHGDVQTRLRRFPLRQDHASAHGQQQGHDDGGSGHRRPVISAPLPSLCDRCRA